MNLSNLLNLPITDDSCLFSQQKITEIKLGVIENSFLGWNSFLEKKQSLDVPLPRIVSNALIQSHFNYACTLWYSYLTDDFKAMLHVTQN